MAKIVFDKFHVAKQLGDAVDRVREFINPNLPTCAVIRADRDRFDERGAINGFIADGLFIGQPKAFTNLLLELAQAADAAIRIAL
jgi:hypothetical protein